MSEEKDLSQLSAGRKKELADRVKARSIVQSILDFGITDSVNREILKMLALELENRNSMLKILEALGDSEESEPEKEVKIYL